MWKWLLNSLFSEAEIKMPLLKKKFFLVIVFFFDKLSILIFEDALTHVNIMLGKSKFNQLEMRVLFSTKVGL